MVFLLIVIAIAMAMVMVIGDVWELKRRNNEGSMDRSSCIYHI